jgi:hypothetical protein
MERVHIEGKIIQFSLVICDGVQLEVIETDELIHELPHLFIGCMENMRAILVYVYALNVLLIHVAPYMRARFNYHNRLINLFSAICECCSIKT